MSPGLSPIYLSSIFLFLCTTIKAWATTSYPNSTTTASLTPTYCGGCYVDFEKEAATRWWSDVFVDYVATIVYTVQGESTIGSQTITETDTSTLSADIYSAAYDYCLRGGHICQGTANATFVDAATAISTQVDQFFGIEIAASTISTSISGTCTTTVCVPCGTIPAFSTATPDSFNYTSIGIYDWPIYPTSAQFIPDFGPGESALLTWIEKSLGVESCTFRMNTTSKAGTIKAAVTQLTSSSWTTVEGPPGGGAVSTTTEEASTTTSAQEVVETSTSTSESRAGATSSLSTSAEESPSSPSSTTTTSGVHIVTILGTTTTTRTTTSTRKSSPSSSSSLYITASSSSINDVSWILSLVAGIFGLVLWW